MTCNKITRLNSLQKTNSYEKSHQNAYEKSEEIVMKNNCIKRNCNMKNRIKIHMRNRKINSYELRRIEHNYYGQLNYVIQWRSENRHMYALLK